MNQQSSSNAVAFESVLPKVQYEQTPDGVRLNNVGTSHTKAILLLVASIAAMIAVVMLFWLILRASGEAGLLIMPSLFGIGSVVFFVYALRKVLVASAFGSAELYVDTIPLSLGQAVNIRYRRPIRGNYVVTSVSGTLICQEWVRYRVGTDTRTATNQLCSLELPSPERVVSPIGGIDVAWTITIPRNMPPSFEATDNAVKWLLRITAQVEKFPDPNIEILLPIQPEVIR